MRKLRWVVLSGLLAVAACSSSTAPIPDPGEDTSKKPDPNHPGFVMPVALLTTTSASPTA
jgi:hypothetical protein